MRVDGMTFDYTVHFSYDKEKMEANQSQYIFENNENNVLKACFQKYIFRILKNDQSILKACFHKLQ